MGENNIWAVGEINTDSGEYNAARWDGKQWHLIKIKPQGYVQSLQSIFTVNMNDIWFGRGSLPIHYNGKTYTMLTPNDDGYPGGFIINAIWGTSSSNLYFVGTGGSIVHYDGATFTRVASGTELDFTDIWGAKDPFQILAVANDQNYTTLQTTVVQIKNGDVSPISLVPITYPLSTVWFLPNRHYYVGGSGLYEKTHLSDEFWENNMFAITRYYVTQIRGAALNDVWAVGAYGEVLHWNGLNWHSLRSATGLGNGAYTALAVDRNTVIAVGGNAGYAVILRGRRE